jgi:hypothetical protein
VRPAWLWSMWARVSLGLLVGAAVGLGVYGAGRLTGPSLFILAGGAAGGAAAALVALYGHTVRLTDIMITVPQFSRLHFAVTKDSEQVAWKLFVEAVTRISTQPLDRSSGLVREALTSLYSLFSVTREVLKQAPPSVKAGKEPTVEHLAIAMLNKELRPFLSRWHPVLLEWEKAHPDQADAAWPQEAECRAELLAMQQRLAQYVLGFGRLAGLPNAQEMLEGALGPQFDQPVPRGSAQPHQPSAAGTP